MHRGRLATIAVAVLAITILAVSPTQADVKRFRDSRQDTPTGIDIWTVRVDNSERDRSKVIVTVQQDHIEPGDKLDIFFDTRPNDPGPEYLLSGAAASEYLMRHAGDGRATEHAVPGNCGYDLKMDERHDRSRAVVSPSCLNRPGKIRIAVRASRGYDPVTSWDWAPAPQTWLDWVRR